MISDDRNPDEIWASQIRANNYLMKRIEGLKGQVATREGIAWGVGIVAAALLGLLTYG